MTWPFFCLPDLISWLQQRTVPHGGALWIPPAMGGHGQAPIRTRRRPSPRQPVHRAQGNSSRRGEQRAAQRDLRCVRRDRGAVYRGAGGRAAGGGRRVRRSRPQPACAAEVRRRAETTGRRRHTVVHLPRQPRPAGRLGGQAGPARRLRALRAGGHGSAGFSRRPRAGHGVRDKLPAARGAREPVSPLP